MNTKAVCSRADRKQGLDYYLNDINIYIYRLYTNRSFHYRYICIIDNKRCGKAKWERFVRCFGYCVDYEISTFKNYIPTLKFLRMTITRHDYNTYNSQIFTWNLEAFDASFESHFHSLYRNVIVL